MIGFLIKKSFFDAWDNLISLVLINFGFLACFAAVALLPTAAGTLAPGAALLFIIPGFVLAHLYAGTVSAVMFEVSDYKSAGFDLLRAGIRKTWKASLFLAALNGAMVIIQGIALPFLFSTQTIPGGAGGIIVFWIGLLWLLSSQYFLPVYIRLDSNIKKCLKKSILITLDNLLYSLIFLFLSIVISAVSIVTAFIMPGFSAVLLLHQDALKLLLYKYDWLEENKTSERRKIPWPGLLEHDKETIGHRTLKGMVFPWKG